ncbi:MAG TPA: hypothetical protein VE309_04945, partial [Caulobacteraceae bacterium]|nr:hypothetical protein [Caulobacteraceae bacterium]
NRTTSPARMNRPVLIDPMMMAATSADHGQKHDPGGPTKARKRGLTYKGPLQKGRRTLAQTNRF